MGRRDDTLKLCHYGVVCWIVFTGRTGNLLLPQMLEKRFSTIRGTTRGLAEASSNTAGSDA
jgi:hypothetical protein